MMKYPMIKEIEGVGTLRFEKSRRARKLNISIEPTRVIRVAVPYRTSLEEAVDIIDSNTAWVKRYLSRMEKVEEEHRTLLSGKEDISTNEAYEKIALRLSELARKHGFKFNKARIRDQKTRWGSCSPKNNINLNLKLAKLPDELIDYVIIHELVHTEVKNHKADFWGRMDSIFGDAKSLDARLRKYHLSLM